MHLCIVNICERVREEILIVPRVIDQEMSQCRQNCAIEALDLAVALWMVRRSVVTFSKDYPAHIHKELIHKLAPVVG